MKKTLTLAAIFVAMASFGGSALLAHAQSLTPAQAAADQQELAVLKAQLIQLQMQEGMVPAGDSGLPSTPTGTVSPSVTVTPTQTSMMLSASDVVAINTALNSLKGALISLQADVANNPQILTTNGQGVANVLQGINTTLASIGDELQNGSIAMTQPSQSSGGQTPVVVSTGGSTGAGIAQSNPTAPTTAPTAAATTPTTPAPTVAVTPSANTVPQTAQAAASFSAGKLNWPLIIVIVLIVAAIAIWLWWDDGDDKKAKPVVKNISSAPKPSAPVVQITNNNAPTSMPAQSTSSSTQPTPMSSVVSNPQQTRKPA